MTFRVEVDMQTGERREIPLTPEEISAAQAAANSPEVIRERIMAQIYALEAQITPRRMREAILGTDGGWLAGIEANIEAIRAQL